MNEKDERLFQKRLAHEPGIILESLQTFRSRRGERFRGQDLQYEIEQDADDINNVLLQNLPPVCLKEKREPLFYLRVG